jgi:hypothetical protein
MPDDDDDDHVLQFFAFAHLRADLQQISAPFAALADIIAGLPRNPERTKSLDLLLAAKDAAVRAKLAKGGF